MSLADTVIVKQYAIAAPFTGPWTFDCKFWDKAEMIVVASFPTIADVTLVLDTDYGLTSPAVGGTVSRISDWTTKWSEQPDQLTIYRSISEAQGSAYPGGPLPSSQIADDFDKTVAKGQQHKEALSRAIRVPITDPIGATTTLPRKSGAMEFIVRDAGGNITVAQGSVPAPYLKKILDIGDWNMDTTASVTVAHGLTYAKIVRVTANIRKDDDSEKAELQNAGTVKWGATNVTLARAAGGDFDGTDFDLTPFNRGKIVIDYEP